LAEVRKGANKQSTEEINKERDHRDESVCDHYAIPSVNTGTQQAKLSPQQSTDHDQPFTSVPECTTREYDIPGVSMEKYDTYVNMNGYGVIKLSSDSLDDTSYVAVVNQNLYYNCRGHMKYEMCFVQNTDHTSLFSASNLEKGYSSSQVEGWV